MVGDNSLAAAAQRLVASDKCSMLIDEMRKVLRNWAYYPDSWYEGEHECLNWVLAVGLNGQDKFERLVAAIEAKRGRTPQSRRNAYQRDFMRRARARLAKALALHSASTGSGLRNKADSKLIEAQIKARWTTARKKFLGSRGKLDWNSKNAAASEFWAMIDAQLDASLADVPAGLVQRRFSGKRQHHH